MEKKLSTESYKGVRDFYPEDFAVLEYIFTSWRKTLKGFGYEEYNASVLEPAELYRAKSGEEIVNEQTYTFTDRGDREVTLRPEMTPTVARMVAARRRELPLPIRWFSIPNVFRYEKPQRGRLREHFQLNVDLFGVDSIEADFEMILIASNIMKNLGVDEEKYEIKLNSRSLMDFMMQTVLGLSPEITHKLGKLIDRKNKVTRADFESEAELLCGNKSTAFLKFIDAPDLTTFQKALGTSHESFDHLESLIRRADDVGIENVVFDQTLMRGFDYYTGLVFEVFDKHPDNRRALFGGGRYDDLLSLFGGDKIPAIGFGMGDVTTRDVLETYGLLPKTLSVADVALCPLSFDFIPYAQHLAIKLRAEGARVSIDITGKRLGDQIKNADKKGIPFVLPIGEDEVKNKVFKIKHLSTGKEVEVTEDSLIETLTTKEK
jgi:histidyl-tRNA synthetase